MPTLQPSGLVLKAVDGQFVISLAEAKRCRYFETLLEMYDDSEEEEDEEEEEGDKENQLLHSNVKNMRVLPLPGIQAEALSRLVLLMRCDDLPLDMYDAREKIRDNEQARTAADLYPGASWINVLGEPGSASFRSLVRAADMCMFNEVVLAAGVEVALRVRGKTPKEVQGGVERQGE